MVGFTNTNLLGDLRMGWELKMGADVTLMWGR
jgi:hypothetical protein